VTGVLCRLVEVYILVLLARAVMSWIPLPRGSGWASVARVLGELTEPVLTPLRRLIPPAGPIDVSFLVLFFALTIVHNAVLRCPRFIF
jgi:YggT family protein